MINIREINKTTDTSTSKTRKTSGAGESFSSYLQGLNKSENKSVSATSGITSADAIFAAQLVNDEEGKARRKQAIKRGYTLLDKLEEIRDALLLGYISKDKLSIPPYKTLIKYVITNNAIEIIILKNINIKYFILFLLTI